MKVAPQKSKDLGKLGEDAAVRFLKKNKYQILARNFRSRFGEIDIVAKDPSAGSTPNGGQAGRAVLVFVEVKTRWSEKFGRPEEAITPWKIKRIIKAGQYYKLLHPETPEAMRLDAVAVDMDSHGVVREVRIIRNLTSLA